MQHSTEYDSDFEQKTVQKKRDHLKVVKAHAELLNFFAQCDDSEDEASGNSAHHAEDQD